jgi:NADPH:quinone reductase-like Zn-dependent oxidoreductase
MPSTCPTSSLPKQQTAIVAQGPGKLAIQRDVPLPALAPDMAIVKTAAVAINPADAKMLDYSAAPGAIHGYDFAGTVVALGSDAIASGHLSVGDRVAGLVHGMNKLRPDVGAFAEYVGAYADLLLRIPDQMSFEEAASFGTGLATASLSLFSELGVPASLDQLGKECKPLGDEKDEREFVLVAGGSTATGTRAIQLLKL